MGVSVVGALAFDGEGAAEESFVGAAEELFVEELSLFAGAPPPK